MEVENGGYVSGLSDVVVGAACKIYHGGPVGQVSRRPSNICIAGEAGGVLRYSYNGSARVGGSEIVVEVENGGYFSGLSDVGVGATGEIYYGCCGRHISR